MNSHLLSSYRKFSRTASALVITVGILVLAGWLFDVPALTSIRPGLASMKANTALAFMLAGVSLWLLAGREHKDQRRDLIARACATITALIGLLTLGEYIFSWDLGIDQLLFRDLLTPENANPGRMSPVTAVNFSLLGLALLLDRRQARRLVEAFTITALLISVLALIGYAYGAQSLYNFFPYSSVAIHTAFTFSTLSLGILFARPEQGLMKLFSSDNLGGLMARRLTPAALVIPFVLGWLFLTGERMGFYDSILRLVLFATSNVIVFAILIWWNASLLQRADLVRQQAEAEMQESEIKFSAAFHASPVMLAITTLDGKLVEVNQAFCDLVGYSRQESIGNTVTDLGLLSIQDREKLVATIMSGGGSARNFEVQFHIRDGSLRDILYSLEPISFHGVIHRLSTGIDITERKRAEQKLHEQNQRLKVLREIDVAILASDSMENVVGAALGHIRELIDCRRANLTLIDWGTNESVIFEVSTANETLIPKGTRFPLAQYQDIIQTLSLNQVLLMNDLRALADPRPAVQKLLKDSLQSLCSVPLSSEGKLIGMVSIYSEIPGFFDEEKISLAQEVANQVAIAVTQNRLVEALRDSENKFSTLFNKASLPVLLSRFPDAVFVDVNEAWVQLFGYTREELIGRTSVELGINRETELRTRTIDEIRQHNQMHNLEQILFSKSGEALTVLINVNRITISGEDYAITSVQDITKRKQAEEKTQLQLERLKALRAIDIAISSSFDLRLTLDILLDYVVTQLKTDAAAILLLHPTIKTLEYAASRGFRSTAIRETRLRLGEGYAGKAIIERRLVHISNLMKTDSELTRALLLKGEDFIEYYCVPLIVKGEVNGVLEIFHRSALNNDPEWVDFLETLAGQAAIAIENANLFEDLQHSNSELFQAYDATIEGWSHALDLRDKETEGHSLRVTALTLKLASKFDFTEEQLRHIRWGALLHDIGKMGVPDNILLKPDKLTNEEWEHMKQHPVFALEMLSPIAYLKTSLDIPYCHHEKWDGTGYPRGLKGDMIPLAARLFAIVDAWDALRSDRPYRKAWSVEKTIEHIKFFSGTHFDPQVVEHFLGMIERAN